MQSYEKARKQPTWKYARHSNLAIAAIAKVESNEAEDDVRNDIIKQYHQDGGAATTPN